MGYVNVSHDRDSNLNISPKMPQGVLECDCYITELHAYDFVIKDFVIKSDIICARPHVYVSIKLI